MAYKLKGKDVSYEKGKIQVFQNHFSRIKGRQA